jgi:hypothetical protein
MEFLEGTSINYAVFGSKEGKVWVYFKEFLGSLEV